VTTAASEAPLPPHAANNANVAARETALAQLWVTRASWPKTNNALGNVCSDKPGGARKVSLAGRQGE
jgi:hypothetical protein